MVQHGAGAQHDVPAVSVLIHGAQHEHHREKGHGQAAGGDILEGVQPARQFPAGKDAHQLAHRHHGADAGRKDVGILGVKNEHLLFAPIPAHGQGNGLRPDDEQVQCDGEQAAHCISKFFHGKPFRLVIFPRKFEKGQVSLPFFKKRFILRC